MILGHKAGVLQNDEFRHKVIILCQKVSIVLNLLLKTERLVILKFVISQKKKIAISELKVDILYPKVTIL